MGTASLIGIRPTLAHDLARVPWARPNWLPVHAPGRGSPCRAKHRAWAPRKMGSVAWESARLARWPPGHWSSLAAVANEGRTLGPAHKTEYVKRISIRRQPVLR